jgi:hypothetical protein
LKGTNISTKAVIRACIGKDIKDEVAAVLVAMELTVSDAFRMMSHSLPYGHFPCGRVLRWLLVTSSCSPLNVDVSD